MATVFITRHPGAIEFRGRLAGAGARGDFTRVLRPGETLGGRTFAEWAEDPRTQVDDSELVTGQS